MSCVTEKSDACILMVKMRMTDSSRVLALVWIVHGITIQNINILSYCSFLYSYLQALALNSQVSPQKSSTLSLCSSKFSSVAVKLNNQWHPSGSNTLDVLL